MNIALVLIQYNPFGGYERQAALMAEALAERGDHITVFASEWTGEHRNNITFHRVPLVRLTSWLKVLTFALFSWRSLTRVKGRFDAVIAFDRTLVMDIYRAGNACHREWVRFRKEHGTLSDAVSVRINPLHTVINRIERYIFSRLQKRNGTIVVLSSAGEEQIRKHYCVDKSRFIVIPPIIDVKRFNSERVSTLRQEQRKRLRLSDDTVMLLHVGSGFRIKGLQSTIEAVSILLQRGDNIALIVVGADRKGTRRYRRLCRELGVEKAVHFLGGVKDVGRFYAAADIFVVPSLFETFNIAAIEALSCGLPVIIGRGAGASYLIEQEKAGKVIDVPADPHELADMMEETAKNEKELKLSGKIERAKQHRMAVASKCDCPVVMKELLAIIDQMAEKQNFKEM